MLCIFKFSALSPVSQDCALGCSQRTIPWGAPSALGALAYAS